MDQLKTEYNRRPLINENDDVSLGLAGAVGFLGLLWWFFFRKPAAEGVGEPGAAGLLHRLSIFTLAGLLFGTMGGFGSLVAFFGLPQVRAYNRIGVFLCFFAFFALALWLDQLVHRHVKTPARRMAFGGALGIATALALCDQISPTALPDYAKVRQQFASDAAFVREVEKSVPHGALIFQLPFMTFPESASVSRMKDYDLLRGYLHSTHLRWSYGTIKGRESTAWLRHTLARPMEQLVETVAWAGFSGIYVDRNGFDDQGARVERELYDVLEAAPIHSPDRMLAFHNLTEYRRRLEQRTPWHQWEARREAARHPPLIVWRDGCSDPEGTPYDTWRWCGSNGRIELINRAARSQRVRLEMTVAANRGGSVTIETTLFGGGLKIDGNNRNVDKTFVLPPGKHLVHFASDAPPAYPPNDFRDLVFSVQNLSLTPVQGDFGESPSVAQIPPSIPPPIR